MLIQKLINHFAYPERKIDQFLDGTLTETERDLFEKKCLEDRTFFLKVQEREVLRSMIAHTIAEKGKDLAARDTSNSNLRAQYVQKLNPLFRNPRLGWACALLAVALLSLGIFLMLPAHKGSYAVNTELERELGARVLRSGTVQVLSPDLPAWPETEVLFSWHSPMKGSFEVLILDNHAEVVASLYTDSLSIRYPLNLSRGLYYWKLLQNDDWIYTGKFIIQKK